MNKYVYFHALSRSLSRSHQHILFCLSSQPFQCCHSRKCSTQGRKSGTRWIRWSLQTNLSNQWRNLTKSTKSSSQSPKLKTRFKPPVSSLNISKNLFSLNIFDVVPAICNKLFTNERITISGTRFKLHWRSLIWIRVLCKVLHGQLNVFFFLFTFD